MPHATAVLLSLMVAATACGSAASPNLRPAITTTTTATSTTTTAQPTITDETTTTTTTTSSTTTTAQPTITDETTTTTTEAATSGDEGGYFWNTPMQAVDVTCADGGFAFTAPVIDPADANDVMFSPGSHVTPHDHMAYWSTSNSADPNGLHVSRRVPLSAPVDVYIVDLWWEQRSHPDHGPYLEWGSYLYTCDGHQLMFGHVADPTDELLEFLASGVVQESMSDDPNCDLAGDQAAEIGTSCRRTVEAHVPAGTPLFSSSGIAAGFDFGLSLFGLTIDELTRHPSYGFSITPWRSGSGRSVCPLEYFPEPWRSQYLNLMSSVRCGPFNQDVQGTAMGLWFPSPSPDQPPRPWEGWPDEEWDSIWLSTYHAESTKHELSVPDDSFGLRYGKYVVVTAAEGTLNRRWDDVTPGGLWCFELRRSDSAFSHEPEPSTIALIELSADARALTIEGFDRASCTGDLAFSDRARTFHR